VGVVVNGVCNAAILFDFAADQNYGDFVKTIKCVFVKLRAFTVILSNLSNT
jgi:hypothetical protein